MPFSNELTYLVPSHIQAMETSSTELTFHIFNLQLNLPPEHVVILGFKITQCGFNYSAFNDFSADSSSDSFSNTCFTK